MGICTVGVGVESPYHLPPFQPREFTGDIFKLFFFLVAGKEKKKSSVTSI